MKLCAPLTHSCEYIKESHGKVFVWDAKIRAGWDYVPSEEIAEAPVDWQTLCRRVAKLEFTLIVGDTP